MRFAASIALLLSTVAAVPAVAQGEAPAVSPVLLTDEAEDLKKLVSWVDELFIGEHCGRCRLRDRCPDPLDNHTGA